MKNENEDGDFSKLVMELATGLAEAVMKDEVPEEGGFDLSAGFNPRPP